MNAIRAQFNIAKSIHGVFASLRDIPAELNGLKVAMVLNGVEFIVVKGANGAYMMEVNNGKSFSHGIGEWSKPACATFIDAVLAVGLPLISYVVIADDFAGEIDTLEKLRVINSYNSQILAA